jgi:hypothetical protein
MHGDLSETATVPVGGQSFFKEVLLFLSFAILVHLHRTSDLEHSKHPV